MILQKLSHNINELIRKNQKHFTIKTVLTIAISLIDRLESLHDKGFLHCDLKPDNVMIGDYKTDFNERNVIYLIDFGLSSTYLDDKGNHKPLMQGVSFKGNVVFSSKNAFAKVTLSRRDDMISLVYLLDYLIDTNLRWYDNKKPIKE